MLFVHYLITNWLLICKMAPALFVKGFFFAFFSFFFFARQLCVCCYMARGLYLTSGQEDHRQSIIITGVGGSPSSSSFETIHHRAILLGSGAMIFGWLIAFLLQTSIQMYTREIFSIQKKRGKNTCGISSGKTCMPDR